MSMEYRFRPATAEDAREIADLIAISSDGVAMIEWQEAARKEGVEPLDIGERNYRNPEGNYSWRNCTIVEQDGKTAGMLLAFAMPKTAPRDVAQRPTKDDANVLAPYIYLEEPDSWYICGVALYPEHRGQGIGTKLMSVANEQARQNGFNRLSLVAFAQNEGSVRLYKRLGYEIVDHAPVIPHPLIHCRGEALLMVYRLD
jgi:ribosomal protein S18 acetylase RimI-like enzyme